MIITFLYIIAFAIFFSAIPARLIFLFFEMFLGQFLKISIFSSYDFFRLFIIFFNVHCKISDQLSKLVNVITRQLLKIPDTFNEVVCLKLKTLVLEIFLDFAIPYFSQFSIFFYK